MREALERAVSGEDLEGAYTAQREIGQRFIAKLAEIRTEPEKLRESLGELVSSLKENDAGWTPVQTRVVMALVCAGMSNDELGITGLWVSRVAEQKRKEGDKKAARVASGVVALLLMVQDERSGMD